MRLLKHLLGKQPRPARAPQAPAFLRTEELEARWNPSTSTNWSGYAVPAAAGSVTAVSGEWTVPTVTGTGTAYSSVWVGIDGYNSSSVEQTGIAADVVNGVSQYYAWYEMYPSAPVEVNVAIHAGDTISASVTYSATTGKFTMSITDLSDKTNNSFSISESGATFQRSSAEWIVEAPSSNSGVLPLANFGTATFTNASATINGTTGSINNSAWAGSVNAINMVSASGKLEASTSALNATGTGFTVTDAAAVPPVSPPPASPPTAPPPVSPPPPASPPPATGSVATTTTLTGVVDPNTRIPTVTLTVAVSPSVPSGSLVALIGNGSVLGYGRVEKVGGAEEVSFEVEFFEPGTYTFTAEYMGAGQYAASVSNSLTVTVSGNANNYWEYLLASMPSSQRHGW